MVTTQNQPSTPPLGPEERATWCRCCGSTDLGFGQVLWPELIQAWRLAPAEVAYVDRQQGVHCKRCGSNLRSMALAQSIMDLIPFSGTFDAFMSSGPGRELDLLEINEAGHLTRFLSKARGHRLTRYPEVDMHHLPFPDRSFDLVVHSDTLEHVERPVLALSECRRVLRERGVCAFTVPMVVDRLTLSREGMPPSYHNTPAERDQGLVVRTEYGADAWKHVLAAGFRDCRLVPLEYPATVALLGTR